MAAEILEKCLGRVLNEGNIEFSEALALAEQVPPAELYQAADTIRKKLHSTNLDLCSIVNARSGKCSEDCKFCAQSSHYAVAVESYDIVDIDLAITMAKENQAHGVRRFSLVTAGKTVSEQNLEEFRGIYQRLQDETNLSLCASMGFLTAAKARKLKSMGVDRYHCNLETARSYFPSVCTSHSWDEKVTTIQIAQDAGLEVCSGGIIGLGESLAQRIELAFELSELGILSIPLNILNPIPNTPFGDLPPLSVGEVLTAIALFRFINPQAVIRLAGGRNLLGDEQNRCFIAGANGAIVGNYLTTVGNKLAEDIEMFRQLGFKLDI